MTVCARCHRPLAAPIFAGGLAFGRVCYRKVAGGKPRRVRKAVEVQAVDPRQAELFEEVRDA